MKVLLTGGTGFLGTNLIPRLYQAFDEENVLHPASHVFDLRLQAHCKSLITYVRPDIVIHAAGTVGGIGANKDNPGKFMYENLIMGANIIEECRKSHVGKFIMLGTVCSYPKFTPIPFNESDFWNGYPEETNAPYGIAKKTLIEMLIGYRKQYGFKSNVLVPTNMYGPHDHFNLTTSHVIPALIMKVDMAIKNNEESITVWGTGVAHREFLYVDDCVDAIMRAIQTDTDSQPINIGNGQETKISELITMICDIMGYRGTIEFDTTKPDGQPRRCLDVSRAQEVLNFTAKTSLREGLEKTINWYKENV